MLGFKHILQKGKEPPAPGTLALFPSRTPGVPSSLSLSAILWEQSTSLTAAAHLDVGKETLVLKPTKKHYSCL